MSPVSSEDEIRTDAASVVPSVPLPEPLSNENSPKVVSSSKYGIAGVQQSDIGDLTPEDIREENF